MVMSSLQQSFRRRALAFALLSLFSAAAAAQAVLRVLPADAKRGQMQPPVANKVSIDGKSYPLAPGLRLRDAGNVIIFPDFVKQAVTVRYTVDMTGHVDRIWILSAEEKALPDNPR